MNVYLKYSINLILPLIIIKKDQKKRFNFTHKKRCIYKKKHAKKTNMHLKWKYHRSKCDPEDYNVNSLYTTLKSLPQEHTVRQTDK